MEPAGSLCAVLGKLLLKSEQRWPEDLLLQPALIICAGLDFDRAAVSFSHNKQDSVSDRKKLPCCIISCMVKKESSPQQLS